MSGPLLCTVDRELGVSTTFRSRSAGVTQEMVKNPNSVIQNALHGQTIKSRTFTHVSTTHSPIHGGGTQLVQLDFNGLRRPHLTVATPCKS